MHVFHEKEEDFVMTTMCIVEFINQALCYAWCILSKYCFLVYLTVDRQLLPDRHELKTVYLITFEMIDNSKRADKMWETRNSNTESSEMTENSKSVVEIGETGTGKQLWHMISNNVCMKLDEVRVSSHNYVLYVITHY